MSARSVGFDHTDRPDSNKQKIALLDALFGEGSLRRKQDIGLYIHKTGEREFSLEMAGRFGPIMAPWPEEVVAQIGRSVDPKRDRLYLSEERAFPCCDRMQRFHNA